MEVRRRFRTRLGRRWPLLVACFCLVGTAHAEDAERKPTPSGRAAPVHSFTLDDLKTRLEAEGLTGTMHGANHHEGTYVFTWTNPRDFFNNFQISLIAADKGVQKVFSRLDRH